ncbi:MAG: DUF1295 domain-containing protein [Deltaproteobacteria bacterium]|nr:DUF1295 domain-containing protein [Candidatus Zymogenaceae bacterium]
MLIIRVGDGAGWRAVLNRDVLFAATYIVWIFAEWGVSKREMDRGDKTRDYGTCGLYAVGQAAVFLSALFFAPAGGPLNALHVVGFIIFLSGVIFRLWAIRTLGRYYSHIVREVDDHKIVDTGPYRVIRHPAYLGMIAANVGVTVFFFNYATLCLLLFMLVPAIVLRIIIEERTLFAVEGYRAFARRRKRLIPGVW